MGRDERWQQRCEEVVRFIYDPTTGALYHDPDGIAGDTQTQFAQLDANLGHFGAGNILVV